MKPATHFAALLVAAAMLLPAASSAASGSPPAEWDGLVKVKAKRADAAYLLPGADFRNFTKVAIDPVEVAVDDKWAKDYNRSTGSTRRISDEDIRKLMAGVGEGFSSALGKSLTKAGYTIAGAPGPDVLRVRSAVVNVRVVAPDLPTAGRSKSYSREAGSATLVLELRDGVTNALLGRAVDSRTIGDVGFAQTRNSVSNRADFEMEFRNWADGLVKGLAELKAKSPLAIPAPSR